MLVDIYAYFTLWSSSVVALCCGVLELSDMPTNWDLKLKAVRYLITGW